MAGMFSEKKVRLFFLGFGIFFFVIALFAITNLRDFSLALCFSLIFSSIVWYPFNRLEQAIILFLAWFLAIYGMMDIISGGILLIYSAETVDIGAWLLVLPGIGILNRIATKVLDKYVDWSITSMAALDSLFLISMVLVAFSGIANIERLKMDMLLTGDWRFIFTPGVGLLIWVASYRQKNFDRFPHKELLIFSTLANPLIFISGMYLTLQSTVKYFFFSQLQLIVFLIEGMLGFGLMYVAYYFSYKMKKSESRQGSNNRKFILPLNTV